MRFGEDVDAKLVEEVLESINNVDKVVCPPQLLDVISKRSVNVKSLVKSEEESGEEAGRIETSADELVGKVSDFLGEVSSFVSNLLDNVARYLAGKALEGKSINLLPSLSTVYDGPLDLTGSLAIELDGGVVEISKGEPHLLAKCHSYSDLDISKGKIVADGCAIKVTCPDLDLLKVKVDGGMVHLNDVSASNLLIEVDGGAVKLGNPNVRSSASIDIDGGMVTGVINFSQARDAGLNVNVDGGVVNLDLVVPKDVGIIVESRVDGGRAELPKARGGTRGYLKVRVSAYGGLIRVKERDS